MTPHAHPQRQAGLSIVGAVFVFGLIALAALLVVKCLPLYLNQMKIARAVHGVSIDPELAGADAGVLRERLQRRWDIESIDALTPQDVKVRRSEAGRALVYDYEARTHLFYNVSLVLHFAGDVPLPTSAQP